MSKERLLYNVRFGAHPINWVNDDMHDLGDFITFDEQIDEMQKAGYEGTELGRKYPRDPKTLKEALKKRNLVLTSGWTDIMFTNEKLAEEYYAAFEKQTLFLKEMGCKYVIGAEGGGSTNWDPTEDRRKFGVKKMDEKQWTNFARGLERCGSFCKKHGMEFVLHVHTGTVIETYEETKKLLDMTDPELVFILADTGHLYYCGVDINKFFKDFSSRIRYVHFKDVREDVLKQVKEFHLDFNSAVRVGVFTVPGDGAVDFQSVVNILNETDYQGWILVEAEQNALYFNPLEYAIKARNHLLNITGM